MLLEVVRAGEAFPAVPALVLLRVAAVNPLVQSLVAYPRESPSAALVAAGVRLFTCAAQSVKPGLVVWFESDTSYSTEVESAH